MPVPAPADWSSRLFDLRRARGWDQQQMGDALGVTREWVSRLERGKGEFSEIIRLKIVELEGGKPADHKSVFISHAAEDTDIVTELRQHLETLVIAAKNDRNRLGWISEQMRAHLSLPKHWMTNEELNRRARELVAQNPRLVVDRPQDHPGAHTEKSA